MTDQTLDQPTTTTQRFNAGDIVRTSAGFVAVVETGDWEKGIYRLSSGSAKWPTADLTLIATTHVFPIYLFVALCKAFDAQDSDLNGKTLLDKPGAGWRPHHQVGGAKNADKLVELGFYEMDAAGKGSRKPVVDKDGPRYRITALGREVRNAMKHAAAKAEASNPDAHIATLTAFERGSTSFNSNPEAPDEDIDALVAEGYTDLAEAYIEAGQKIDGIVAAVIGDWHLTETTSTVDNVQALADAYASQRRQSAVLTMEVDKLNRQINALKLEIDQSRHALPMPNELTDLRDKVARLEAENAQLTADLRTAQNRRAAAPQSAAPTMPDVEIKFIFEDVSHPGGRTKAGTSVESYVNDGWVIKYETIDNDGYYARLERNKPAQPDQPHRAAAEADIPLSAPAGVAVTPVSVPADRISIRVPTPETVPMNASPSPCLERGSGGEVSAVVPMNFTEAMDAFHRGDMTMPQVLAAMDAAALARGRQAYADSLASQPVSTNPSWRK